MYLHCSYALVEFTSGINNRRLKYSCIVTKASIRKPGKFIKSFIGEHLEGLTNKHVRALWFDKTVVWYIPRDIIKNFPKLNTLSIVGCGLKKVNKSDFEGLEENLEGLYLHDNKIESLPNNLFTSMKKLREISFHKNLIKNVKSQLLKPIEMNLKYATFKGNPDENLGNFDANDPQSSIELMKTNFDATNKLMNAELRLKKQRLERLEAEEKLAESEKKITSLTNLVKCILHAQTTALSQISPEAVDADPKSERLFKDMLHFVHTGELRSQNNLRSLHQLASEIGLDKLKLAIENVKVERENMLEVTCFEYATRSDLMMRAAFNRLSNQQRF